MKSINRRKDYFRHESESEKSRSPVQLFATPMDYTVHGIFQARVLQWVAFPFSGGSSQPRDRTQFSRIAGIGNIFYGEWKGSISQIISVSFGDNREPVWQMASLVLTKKFLTNLLRLHFWMTLKFKLRQVLIPGLGICPYNKWLHFKPTVFFQTIVKLK